MKTIFNDMKNWKRLGFLLGLASIFTVTNSFFDLDHIMYMFRYSPRNDWYSIFSQLWSLSLLMLLASILAISVMRGRMPFKRLFIGAIGLHFVLFLTLQLSFQHTQFQVHNKVAWGFNTEEILLPDLVTQQNKIFERKGLAKSQIEFHASNIIKIKKLPAWYGDRAPDPIPAITQGLRDGDVVKDVFGFKHELTNHREIREAFLDWYLNDDLTTSIPITIIRDGKEIELDLEPIDHVAINGLHNVNNRGEIWAQLLIYLIMAFIYFSAGFLVTLSKPEHESSYILTILSWGIGIVFFIHALQTNWAFQPVYPLELSFGILNDILPRDSMLGWHFLPDILFLTQVYYPIFVKLL